MQISGLVSFFACRERNDKLLFSVSLATPADSACLFHFRCEGHQQGGGTASSETALPEPQHLHAEASLYLLYDNRCISLPVLSNCLVYHVECGLIDWMPGLVRFSYRDLKFRLLTACRFLAYYQFCIQSKKQNEDVFSTNTGTWPTVTQNCLQKLPVDFWPLTFFIESNREKVHFIS